MADHEDATRSKRRLVLAAWAVLSVCLTGIGFFAGTHIESDLDRLDPLSTEDLGPVLAEVEERTVSARVEFQGRTTGGTEIVVPAVRPQGVARAVVTEVRLAPGDPVIDGGVLAVVSGRPVFTVVGQVPFYRDIRPQDSGSDVEVLQEILRRHGYRVGDARGVFGQSTARAVDRWYRDRHAVPPAQIAAAEPSPDGDAPAATSSIMLPLNEWVFVPIDGVHVASIAPVGATLAEGQDQLAVLRGGANDVVARADVAQAGQLEVGQRAQVTVVGTTDRLGGVVAGLGPFDASADDDLSSIPGHDVLIRLDDPTAASQLARDQTLLIAIDSGDTKNDSRLAVPVTAIRETDGRVAVLVLRHGQEVATPVRVGAVSDGWAQVAPIEAPLRPGDLVVIHR